MFKRITMATNGWSEMVANCILFESTEGCAFLLCFLHVVFIIGWVGYVVNHARDQVRDEMELYFDHIGLVLYFSLIILSKCCILSVKFGKITVIRVIRNTWAMSFWLDPALRIPTILLHKSALNWCIMVVNYLMWSWERLAWKELRGFSLI
jgi:hypothetical protein